MVIGATLNQSNILKLIKDHQDLINMADAKMIDGVMNQHRWWRINKKDSAITFDEAIGIIKNLGLEVKVFQPEKAFLL